VFAQKGRELFPFTHVWTASDLTPVLWTIWVYFPAYDQESVISPFRRIGGDAVEKVIQLLILMGSQNQAILATDRICIFTLRMVSMNTSLELDRQKNVAMGSSDFLSRFTALIIAGC
jgi:hypothetical protein